MHGTKRLIGFAASAVAAGVTTFAAYQAVDPSTLPENDGKALFTRMCSSCHGLAEVTRARHTPKEWKDIVDDMLSRGMMADDQEIKAVSAYMAANVGRVNVNRASADDLKAALGLTDAEAAALVNARASGATFQTLEDLKNVVGIDAKKMDDRKDGIFFSDR